MVAARAQVIWSMDSARGSKCSPEIVHFVDRSKRRQATTTQDKVPTNKKVNSDANKGEKKNELTFDMRQTRMEVFKFGISGLDDTAKLDAKTAHAIKLGAKPPKNKSINYKDLLEEKKKEKEQARQLREESARYKLENPFKSKAIKGKKRKRDVNDVGKLNCQPGVYRGGVQVIKKSKLFSK